MKRNFFLTSTSASSSSLPVDASLRNERRQPTIGSNKLFIHCWVQCRVGRELLLSSSSSKKCETNVKQWTTLIWRSEKLISSETSHTYKAVKRAWTRPYVSCSLAMNETRAEVNNRTWLRRLEEFLFTVKLLISSSLWYLKQAAVAAVLFAAPKMMMEKEISTSCDF